MKNNNIFEEEKKKRRSNWNMAIGLQTAFDEGPSEYLLELVEKHINGEIEMKDIVPMIKKQYDDMKKNK